MKILSKTIKVLILIFSLWMILLASKSFSASGDDHFDNYFTDVKTGDKYAYPINWVKANNIVRGYKDGTFKPENKINRAEFVKMLILSKYTNFSIKPKNNTKYIDVKKDDWFANYVNFASEEDIIEGYKDGEFKGEKHINFAEASKIISLLHYPEKSKMHIYSGGQHWYSGYIYLFEIHKLPTFSPNHYITRGEMANILYNIYNKKNYEKYPELRKVDKDPIIKKEKELYLIISYLYAGINHLDTIKETYEDFGTYKEYRVKFIERINNKDLYVSSIACQGMCQDELTYFYVNNKNNIEIINTKEREEWISFADQINNIRKNVPEKELDKYLNYIKKYNITVSNELPEKYNYDKNIELNGNTKISSDTNIVPVFNVNKELDLKPYLLQTGLNNEKYGEIFINNKNAIVFYGEDSVLRKYNTEIPFLEDDQIAKVKWDNNIENKFSERGYKMQTQGGCGSINFLDVIDKENFIGIYNGENIMIDPDSQLKKTGVSSNGDNIYEFKNSKHPYLQYIYNVKYYEYEGEKMSYEEFIKNHPIFFWQDSLGRWIMFSSNKFIMQAECGKPVIYLYPEKEMEVSVKVSPQGGFSITEPEHGENGWKVVAKPNGELTEIKTGNSYPYLFWEGQGGIYEHPKKGWGIKKENADEFIKEKLSEFGFNQNEIKDFLEFWSPLLQKGDKPYLFISFWGNKYMDYLAPLEIHPKPDSVLRILMDYKETDVLYNGEAPKIKKFERKGFTVTEWGGTLMK
jgi:hypothetical protein